MVKSHSKTAKLNVRSLSIKDMHDIARLCKRELSVYSLFQDSVSDILLNNIGN